MLAVVAASCDKVPLTSPTGSTISIAVDKNIIPVNGQATVTATVVESAGTAVHNGTVVSFTTTAGRFDPAEATTVNGRAASTFIAPNVSVTATLNAFSGAASTRSGNSSSGGVQVLVGSAAVGTSGVSINAAPSTVPQNGGTVTVTARVLDSSNNPLPSVAVLFTTDQGTLESTTATTDANGSASTRLTTNRVTKVAATVGAATKEFTVNIVTAPTVTIAATGSGHIVGQPVAFTLTPAGGATSNPIQSVVVNWGDGQSQTVTGVTGNVGLTHTYSRAGGYTATATATDINGVQGVSSTAIVVGFEALPTITMSASPANPVPANGLVTFTLTAGAGSAPIRSVRVTLENGTAIYTGTGGGTFSYRFDSGTTNRVTATVTDANGSVGTTSTTIVVS